jgi:Undecaprenyl-phosphate glucose phosphotransferase
MNSRVLHFFQAAFFCLDLISLNIIVWFFGAFLPDSFIISGSGYTYFWIALNVSWFIVSVSLSLYNDKYLVTYEMFSRRTMKAYVYWLIVVFIYLFISGNLGAYRTYIAIVLCCYGMLLLLNRIFYLALQGYCRKRNFLTRKVLIVGYNETAKKLASYLEADGQYTQVVGFCEEKERVRELSLLPIIGPVHRAVETSKQMGVEEIFSTIGPEQEPKLYRVMQEADQHCIRFRFVPDLNLFLNRSFHIQYINDIPVLSVRKEPLNEVGNVIKKRIFDLLVSGFVCVFILPWMIIIIGLLIWLESPGPIFFKQLRTGQNNKPFWCLKFRSMKINSEADNKQAERNDARLTRIGKFLRRTSLDEFPQFINVLKGEMSVVGPRPHMLKHTDDYSKIIKEYMVRHFAKPGVTGWAQVNGFRGEIKTLEQMQGRVSHDLWYAENWNLWLDVRIIFLTIYSIFRGDQNAF